jgi:hypothetical protein
MKTTPFVTAKKAVKDVVPGDIIVSSTTGARLVTGAWRNDQGDFTFFFGLPTVEENGSMTYTPSRSLLDVASMDKCWGESEFAVIVGMASTNQRSEVELLKAQLAARDAALDAVLELATDTSALGETTAEAILRCRIVERLLKFGVHAK